jgi:hypothetical protein
MMQQKWNGTFFEKASLRQLGLRKQLNHPPGERCLNPIRCQEDEFWIIDVTGLQSVTVDFCGCGKGDQRHTVQLLRSRLYPATVVQPQSAATFEVLKLFELLSYESKSSAFEVYQTLSRLTDNTGTNIPNVSTISFDRIQTEMFLFLGSIYLLHAHGPRVAAPQNGHQSGPIS